MGFIGQQYVLPQQRMEQPMSPEMTGPQAQAEQYNEGLLGLDEEVTNYYSDYGALQGFAHDMWNNYQIDVTAPDPTNPATIEAYKMYLQGMSQVQETGNRLKQRQQLFNAAYARSLVDPNVRFAEGMTPETFEPGQVRNLKPTQRAEDIGKRYAKGVNSREEEAQLEAYKQESIDMLKSELENTQNPRNREEIEADIRYLESLHATYDPTKDRDRAALNARAAASAKNPYVSTRFDTIARIQRGDKSVFDGLLDNKGVRIFESYKFDRATGKIWLKPTDGNQPQVIDLKSPDEGISTINRILNKFHVNDDDIVNDDELRGYGKATKSVLGVSDALKEKMSKFDMSGIKNIKKVLTDEGNTLNNGLLLQLNEIATDGNLQFPHDERGLFGANITSVDLDGKNLILTYDEPEAVLDDDGKVIEYTGELIPKAITLRPDSMKDQKFIERMLELNSDDIDYSRYTDKNVKKVRMWNPNGGEVDPNTGKPRGQLVYAERDQVYTNVENGYKIVD